MTKAHDIENAVFYGPVSDCAQFRDLQLTALKSGAALAAQLHDKHVSIAVVPATNPSGITLTGTWPVPDFERADLDSVGVKLTLPFLFCTSALNIPANRIYTCGEPQRTVADFFLRNLFLNASRNAPLFCVIRNGNDARKSSLRHLQRQYFYLLKTQFNEPAFTDRPTDEALNFLAANAFLPVLGLSNALLEQGGRGLRAVHHAPEDSVSATELLSPLKAARATLMTHF